MDLTKNIRSGYYNREFTINTVLTEDGKELIRHASLVNIIFNELDPAPLVSYDLKSPDPNHPMVYCTITDEKRRITAFGESSPLARKGKPIAEAHPGCMAHNAAFDLAAKIFLGIPNDFYTDEEIPNFRESYPGSEPAPEEEIPVVKTEKAPAETSAPAETAAEKKAEEPKKRGRRKEQPAKTDEPAKAEEKKPEPAAEAPVKDEPADDADIQITEAANDPTKDLLPAAESADEELVPAEDSTPAVTEAPASEAKAPETPAKEPEPEIMPVPETNSEAAQYGSIPLNIGLYAKRPNNTIAEVVENDPTFIRNIMKIDKPVAVVAEKIELVRKYLKAAGKEL